MCLYAGMNLVGCMYFGQGVLRKQARQRSKMRGPGGLGCSVVRTGKQGCFFAEESGCEDNTISSLMIEEMSRTVEFAATIVL